MTLALSVVMPVYNEVHGLAEVVTGVARHVLDAVPESELVLVDDCSTDGTAAALEQLAAADPRIRVLRNDVNRGHGPTVRRGIDESAGEWILHVDSDGQLDLAEFSRLWTLREGNELVLGVRAHRRDPRHRRVVTAATRRLTSALAGRRVRDANTPFKLIRRRFYDHVSAAIPENAFAPTILLVLAAHRSGAAVGEVEVTHLPRRHGRSTLRLGRLSSAIARSTVQTLRFRVRRLAAYERFPGS